MSYSAPGASAESRAPTRVADRSRRSGTLLAVRKWATRGENRWEVVAEFDDPLQDGAGLAM